eukprot:TRINITY_DN3829_c0_g1_i1.p1 TRINITY_DN3829_c0_g1~~TRINITY_DN3829_c0_g1_i1.p1  ORF type:complete len:620 (-),score=333.35 TRINITY_DN3829_c0_g1_i1:119-1957(-)
MSQINGVEDSSNQALTSVLEFLLEDKQNIVSWLQRQSSSQAATEALPQFLSLKEKHDRNKIKASDFPEEIQKEILELTEKRQKAQQEIDSIQKAIQIETGSPGNLENDRNRRKLERIRDEVKDVTTRCSSDEGELANLQSRLEAVREEKLTAQTKLNEIKEAQIAAKSAVGTVVEEISATIENKTYEPAYWDDLQSTKSIAKTTNAEIFTAQKAGEKVFVKKFGERRDFEDEVGVIEQLHSGYVLLMYAASMDPQNLFFVSEYKSFNLYNVIKREERIPWDKKWQIACDICHGMWYLHSRSPSVMTRDYSLKVYKCFLGQDFRTKISVADLGIDDKAAVSKQDLDLQHSSPELLSPAASDSLYGEKSDVYAFGVILWMMSEQKDFPWIGDDIAKNITSEERPEIGKDVPEDFAKLIEVSWKMKPEVRQAFKRSGKVFEKKGLMNNRQEESKKAQSKIEELNREMEILKQMLERLEKQHEQAERKFKREKDLTECTEEELNAANARLDLEKKRGADLEKKIQAANQEIDESRKASSVVEKMYTKKSKEKESQQKRLQEELEEERDSYEKKYEMERKRGDNLRSQLNDTERSLDDERYRRTEAEKRRDDYRSRT